MILLFWQFNVSHAQSGIDRFIDFFTIYPNKLAAQQDTALYPAKIIMAPVVSYSPSTSLALGVGAKWLFKFKGSGDETRTSNMPISFQYTLKNQFILFSGFEIFSPQEKWMLEGNIIFRKFPRLYYGVGRDTPDSNEEEYEYNQVLIEPILLKQVFYRYFFLGGGFRYNRISGVEFFDPDGELANSDQFGISGSTSVGLQLAAVFDNRNNLLNSKQGWYFEFTHGFYDELFGSTSTFQLTRIDLRRFFMPFKNRGDVIAIQLKTHFSHKDVPLNEHAFFGGSEIMRGYYEGRFIERNMIAAQVEYRRDIKGRFGMVAFIGAGDVASSIDSFELSNVRPSVGFGLRFLLDKREDLNIRFDWGFGQNTNNYYLNIAEAF
ncbi:BamA/TamA family outer membrane protein [Ekhidna sp.]